MQKPPLCLLCGHLHAPREGRGDHEVQGERGGRCAACGEAQPLVEWQSTEGYRPQQRALLVTASGLGGVFLGVFTALLVGSIVRAPDHEVLIKSLGVLLVASLSALLLWTAGYTLLVRGYRFSSKDGRVFGSITTFAGKVERAFGVHYELRRLDLADLGGARALASLASIKSLKARADTADTADSLAPVEDPEIAAVIAAIFGMAARGEVDVLAGKARRFWVGPKPDHLTSLGDRIWLRARRGAAPDRPFERAFVAHLSALSGGPAREHIEGGYRTAPSRDDDGHEGREAPVVALDRILMRFTAEGHEEGRGAREHLLALLGPAEDSEAPAAKAPAAKALTAKALTAKVTAHRDVIAAVALEVAEWMEAVDAGDPRPDEASRRFG